MAAPKKAEVVTVGCEHYPSLVTYVGEERVEFRDGEAEVSPEVAEQLVGPVDEHGEIVELGRSEKPKESRRGRSRSVPPVDGAGRTDQASTTPGATDAVPLPGEIENGTDGLHGAEPIDGPSTTGLASTSIEGTDGAEAVGDNPTDPAVPNAPSGDPADTTDAGNVGPTA